MNRAYRGGSWRNNARNLRCSYRNNWKPSNTNDNQGFRLAEAQAYQPEHISLTRTPSRPNAQPCGGQSSSGCPVLVTAETAVNAPGSLFPFSALRHRRLERQLDGSLGARGEIADQVHAAFGRQFDAYVYLGQLEVANCP